MKFEVKTRGSKEFYDEMLYVATYFKKFIKNPHKKAWQYTKFLLMYMAISVVMAGCFIALYLMDSTDFVYSLFIGMFALIFLFTVILFVSVKKRIKIYLNDISEKTIEITENEILYSSDTMNLKMKKEEIGIIVINKHSICILPKEASLFAISISNDYLDVFMKGAKENGYDNILVDNR